MAEILFYFVPHQIHTLEAFLLHYCLNTSINVAKAKVSLVLFILETFQTKLISSEVGDNLSSS